MRNGNESSVFHKAIPNVDEWSALVKHQTELYETENHQKMLDKLQNRRDYQKDLELGMDKSFNSKLYL